MSKAIEGVTEVIVYTPADEADKKKNRGFCFVDFDTHKNASAAKRKLANGRVRVKEISFFFCFLLCIQENFRHLIVILQLIGPIQMKNPMKI